MENNRKDLWGGIRWSILSLIGLLLFLVGYPVSWLDSGFGTFLKVIGILGFLIGIIGWAKTKLSK